jgi:hypothetical protein
MQTMEGGYCEQCCDDRALLEAVDAGTEYLRLDEKFGPAARMKFEAAVRKVTEGDSLPQAMVTDES